MIVNKKNLFFFNVKKKRSPRLFLQYKNHLPLQIKIKKILFHKKWAAGRNNSGTRVSFSKGSKKIKHRLPFINFNLRMTCISFISSFFFIPFKNKICTLIYLSSGMVTYVKVTNSEWTLFKLIRLNSLFYQKSFKYKELTTLNLFLEVIQTYSILIKIKKNTPISLLELYPLKGIQYTRSSGSKSLLLKLDTRTGYGLVKLSSGIKKVFSIFSLASNGQVMFPLNSNFKVYKAGYFSLKGKKPKVRGVAMNPIDHPHGGRTKAIKYPRTPWGKTTKYK